MGKSISAGYSPFNTADATAQHYRISYMYVLPLLNPSLLPLIEPLLHERSGMTHTWGLSDPFGLDALAYVCKVP